MHSKILLCVALAAVLFATPLRAGEPAPPVVVSNVKVVSDKVEDLSSMEAWLTATVKDGMTDEQKAIAAFNTTVKFRHHDMQAGEHTGDAFKLFNVYGYGQSLCAQLHLWRGMKLKARGYTLNRWGNGGEVFFDNAWHYMDSGLICYFLKPDGKIASVEELVADVKAWYAKTPTVTPGNVDQIKKFLTESGIAKGPTLLQKCPTMDARGSFTLNWFGWYTAALIFDGTNKTPFVYEEPYTTGYRVNIQLRPGMKLTRAWSNKGLHGDMQNKQTPGCLNDKVGAGGLYYTPAGGDLANGRIGNGILEYAVRLDEKNFGAAVIAQDNIQANGAVQPKIAEKEASFTLRMPCSYLYLTGTLDADATIGAGGAITIEASDNNGNSWKPAGALTAGASKVDLTPIVYDRYDYRLKFTLKGAGTAIKALKLTHDTQHSQRALPALGAGENSLSFSSGPQEGTITVEARHQPGAFPSLADFKAKVENCDEGTLKQWGTLAPVGAQEASLTIPVETPGDIARVRVGCDYRARDAAEGWDIAASFDDGKTWQAAGRAAGPTAQDCASVSVDAPAGVRKALVRISGKSKGGLVLFRERIDADYKESAGAFAPIKVTYEWEENGQAKSDVHIAKSEKDAYKINCAVKPVMKAITLELAE